MSVAVELFGRYLETAGEAAIAQLKRLTLWAGGTWAKEVDKAVSGWVCEHFTGCGHLQGKHKQKDSQTNPVTSASSPGRFHEKLVLGREGTRLPLFLPWLRAFGAAWKREV